MFQPISQLFDGQAAPWQEQDVKYFIEQYLQAATKSSQIHCQAVKAGVAVVRTSSPALVQAALLLEHELRSELEQQSQYTLKQFRVGMG